MELMVIVWLVLLVAFLILETTTVTLICLWFAAGSLAALLAVLLGARLWLQLTLFLSVSTLSLIALRPVFRRFIRPKLSQTNVDAVVGTLGLVTAAVDNVSAVGQVKLGAMEWSARSTSGAPIPVGTLVKVDRIEGVKAFVSPAEIPASR